MVSIQTLGDLKNYVFDFGRKLKANDVVALSGTLGSGKTQFTKYLGCFLHIESVVTSPTFPILLEYQGDFPLYHFDWYRLKSLDELSAIGYYDYLDAGGICVIEWSERFLKALPEHAYQISLHVQKNKRWLIEQCKH